MTFIQLTIDADVASPGFLLDSIDGDKVLLGLTGKGSRDFVLSLSLSLRGRHRLLSLRNSFIGAVDELTILDGAFEEVVVVDVAVKTLVEAILAEIEVALVASAAMPVVVRDGRLAAVAANGKRHEGKCRTDDVLG